MVFYLCFLGLALIILRLLQKMAGSHSGCSPGRLDMLGGVADYSGSLVLEVATSVFSEVQISAEDDASAAAALHISSENFVDDGTIALPLAPLEAADIRIADVRSMLAAAGAPKWCFYVYGSIAVFALNTGWRPKSSMRVAVRSTVPLAQGVSSSASVECATLRALRSLSGLAIEDIALAHWGQQAENHVVGAPCGLMDQLSSMLGQRGAILPILCRPDACEPPVHLPDSVALVGWPSGVKHSVAGESPYLVARTATFMGKRLAEEVLCRKLAFVTELSPSQLSRDVLPHVPATLTGAEFTAKYGAIEDALSVVEPDRTYAVAASLAFPVEENFRCSVALSLLRELASADSPAESAAAAGDASAATAGDKSKCRVRLLSQVGELMMQAHAGYSSIGLGSPETDTMVRQLAAMGPAAGVYGARVSGGGSGGTVVVLCERTALPAVEALARAMTGGGGGEAFPGLIE